MLLKKVWLYLKHIFIENFIILLINIIESCYKNTHRKNPYSHLFVPFFKKFYYFRILNWQYCFTTSMNPFEVSYISWISKFNQWKELLKVYHFPVIKENASSKDVAFNYKFITFQVSQIVLFNHFLSVKIIGADLTEATVVNHANIHN